MPALKSSSLLLCIHHLPANPTHAGNAWFQYTVCPSKSPLKMTGEIRKHQLVAELLTLVDTVPKVVFTDIQTHEDHAQAPDTFQTHLDCVLGHDSFSYYTKAGWEVKDHNIASLDANLVTANSDRQGDLQCGYHIQSMLHDHTPPRLPSLQRLFSPIYLYVHINLSIHKRKNKCHVW